MWRGGTGVAVWKNPAVDDSALQLSTTAVCEAGMPRACAETAQIQWVMMTKP